MYRCSSGRHVSRKSDPIQWAETRPDDGMAIRLQSDRIGIDVDDHSGKRGGATLAEAENRWDRVPYSPRSSARPGDPVSGIRLYRVPEGVKLRDGIEFAELSRGGVDIIPHHHRYAMC